MPCVATRAPEVELYDGDPKWAPSVLTERRCEDCRDYADCVRVLVRVVERLSK